MAWLLLNLVWIRDETLYRKFGFPWNLKKFNVGLCPSSFQAVFGWLLVWSWKIRKKFYSNDSTQNLNLSIFIVMKRLHRNSFKIIWTDGNQERMNKINTNLQTLDARMLNKIVIAAPCQQYPKTFIQICCKVWKIKIDLFLLPHVSEK